jgi:tetratricopeptide (TPR) repeat protein
MELNRKCYAFVLFLMLTCCLSFAQNRKIDSLRKVLKTQQEDSNKVKTLNLLSFAFYSTNPDTTLVIAEEASTLAAKISWPKGEAEGYTNSGIGYAVKANYPKAIEYFLKALKITGEIGDKKDEALNLGDLGNVFDRQGNYPQALDYDLRALKITEEISDRPGQARNLINIGNIYDKQNDYSKALEYQLKALNIEKETGNKKLEAATLSNIGNVYGAQGNYSKALDYYLDALKIEDVIGKNQLKAINLGNIGNVYRLQKDYPKAIEYYEEALKIRNEIGDKNGVAIDIGNMGVLYTKTGKFKDAEEYLKKAIGIDSTVGDLDELRQFEESLSQLYDTTKRYKDAIVYYRKAMVLKDTLFNADKNKALTRNELTYEFEKKQAIEKAEQDKKDAVAEADKRKQTIISWSVSVGLILVIVFAGFILRSLRITSKQKLDIESKNKVIEEKNKDIVDSINYAKRLQDAILPPLNLIKQYFPESFLLYKPKDIVAGDFYWMEKVGDTILIAAADATGHGVPGALVSVVCSNALNRTVKEFKITEPGKILDKVRELVFETFSHKDPIEKESEIDVQDGMDISLCCINTKTDELQWSGAHNSLLYIHNKEIKEVEADKQAIGKVENPFPFTTHNLKLQKGDILYLFTDGYADQFGGPKGKKLQYKQFQENLLTNSNLPLAQQKQELDKWFEEWKGSQQQIDDVLVMGIRV